MDNGHYQALKSKHEALDAEIHAEEQRPHPDDIRLSDLKKRKLRLKEELSEA
ncbi:MAG: YdcH family protein [Pseudomonadota bacterium]